MDIAYTLSQLSHDAQTQHGCLLVKNNRIISTGYNGFPPGGKDNEWPNLRPEKYPYMVHAEENAIISCAVSGTSCEGATAYITGKPCLACARKLISCKIFKWYIGDKTHADCGNESKILDDWISHYNIEIVFIKD